MLTEERKAELRALATRQQGVGLTEERKAQLRALAAQMQQTPKPLAQQTLADTIGQMRQSGAAPSDVTSMQPKAGNLGDVEKAKTDSDILRTWAGNRFMSQREASVADQQKRAAIAGRERT